MATMANNMHNPHFHHVHASILNHMKSLGKIPS